MLELSDRVFKITVINILKNLLEKGNKFEQMGNTHTLYLCILYLLSNLSNHLSSICLSFIHYLLLYQFIYISHGNENHYVINQKYRMHFMGLKETRHNIEKDHRFWPQNNRNYLNWNTKKKTGGKNGKGNPI